MAVLWQQLGSLRQGRASALLHFICLLCLPSGALSQDAKVSNPTTLEKSEVVKGNFSRLFLHVGYHKVVEIPTGSRNISIRETIKSRNYLALKTQSGVSVINGQWAIDRPGVYTAVGTQLTYRRPNEIRSRTGESVTAPGPLSEPLHLYVIYQQPGPSVSYEYTILLKDTNPTPEPAQTVGPTLSGKKVDEQDDGTHNNIIKEKPRPNKVPPDPDVTSDPQTTYTWTKSRHAECSTTCGTGRRQVLWECVEKASQTHVPADLCDPALEPAQQEEECNTQPCPAYWDVGEWSECSRKCGPGTQQRQVICRQVTHVHANGTESWAPVAEEQCGTGGAADRPETRSTCQLKICSQWELRSEWSPCSVPCGVGQRSREVVCVSNQGDVEEEEEECNMNLKPDSLQNCDMGACARSWFTSLWSQRCSAVCGQGNQTRSAVCLMDHVSDLPLGGCDGERPPEVTTCDSGPCQYRLEWYAGPWGQCSAECGNGTQTRSALCILNDNGLVEVVERSKCSGLPEPITAQPCSLKPCGIQWYVTDWSACSRSCDGGYHVREVRCLADNIAPSDHCDPGSTPESREECNQQPCVDEINPQCSDQYHNCNVVVQARLCVYPYYRDVCCVSCSRAQETYPSSFQKKHFRSLEDMYQLPERYTVLKVLGKGGFGVVLKCLDGQTNNTVAIKVSTRTRNLKEEASMLKLLMFNDLDQRSIITFHSELSMNNYLVFEVLDVSLRDYLHERKAPMRLRDIRLVIQQLAMAFDALKKLGVIHTDVKTTNIMLVDRVRRPFVVKLIDFGLAIFKSTAKLVKIRQTSLFRAPEIILGFPYSEAIDIWSLGCVMAIMLCGFALFTGGNNYALLQSIVFLLGTPPVNVLNGGWKSRMYFKKIHKGSDQWLLKTPEQYWGSTIDCMGSTANSTVNQKHTLLSLDDIKTTRLQKKNTTEADEMKECIELLKAMLKWDEQERITPEQILVQPFITMSYPGSCCDNASESTAAESCPGASQTRIRKNLPVRTYLYKHGQTSGSTRAQPPAAVLLPQQSSGLDAVQHAPSADICPPGERLEVEPANVGDLSPTCAPAAVHADNTDNSEVGQTETRTESSRLRRLLRSWQRDTVFVCCGTVRTSSMEPM